MGDNVPLYYGPLFFQGIAFNGIFALSFFLSANRFLLFIYPALHNRLFTTLGTRIMSLVVWIHAFVVVGLSNVFGCVKQFSKDDFYFWYNCSNRVPGKLHYMDLMNYESYAIVCGMIVMYVVIYIKLKAAGYNRNWSLTAVKQEMKYLMQTVLIGVLLVAEICAFVTVPFLGISGYGRFYLNIFLNLIEIANNVVTPIVLLLFNKEIREQLVLTLSSQLHSTANVKTISIRKFSVILL
ncbi:hypothetical protein Q1695_007711 [Nippostrongylus brasiliensis]|nr:hypothetical protein Q1695_007711 [Nippostrongylus brasiliensis]